MTTTNPKNICTSSVHQHLSDADRRKHIRNVISALNAGKGPFAKISLRDIKRLFDRRHGIEFSHTTLGRYAKGDPIVNPEHCKVFGLQPYIQAPACPTCGGACTFDCGTQRTTAKPGTNPARNRRAINLDDADSAFETIADRTSDEWKIRLVKLIMDYGLVMEY